MGHSQLHVIYIYIHCKTLIDRRKNALKLRTENRITIIRKNMKFSTFGLFVLCPIIRLDFAIYLRSDDMSKGCINHDI